MDEIEIDDIIFNNEVNSNIGNKKKSKYLKLKTKKKEIKKFTIFVLQLIYLK